MYELIAVTEDSWRNIIILARLAVDSRRRMQFSIGDTLLRLLYNNTQMDA